MSKHDFTTRAMNFISRPDYRPMKLQGLQQEMGISTGQRKQLRKALRELTREGKLVMNDRKQFITPDHQQASSESRQITGTLSLHPQGFGFLTVDSADENAEIEELFIPPSSLDTARHGDRVLARIVPSTRRGARGGESLKEGKIDQVIERVTTICVGTLKHAGGNWQVVPDDGRIKGPVRITGHGGISLRSGDKAVVKLDDRMDPSQPEQGSVTEVLGRAGDPGVDILSIMRGHGLMMDFPKEVRDEAHAFAQAVTDKEIAERRDIRDWTICTIDPKDARDFDDALSVEEIPEKKGWLRVGIHIADVAHFVVPGKALDREARLRGTSAYLVDRVVPMLPEHLTNDLCSLVPHEDRLAHSVVLDINTHGDVKAVDTFRSVIHSKQRLTYEEAQVMISGGEVEGVDKAIRDRIVTLARLTRKLRKARLREHALAFDMPETRCELDENGDVIGFYKKEAMEAYQLVEECMLMANREVGALLAGKYGTAIYRIHEEPSEADFQEMADQLRQLGVDGVPVSRESLNEIISRNMPEPLRQAVTLTMLKNMNRALYSPELGEHFGLAFDTYTHFTSPIRRYPDLIAHRLLESLEKNEKKPMKDKDLKEVCRHCSERERAAAEAEIETHRVKMIQYYDQKLRNKETGPYPATVSSVMFKGVLVELEESGQRGLIPFPAFQDDYYEANETGTRATGRKTGRVIQMGDKLDVRLESVDVASKQVNFRL
jgi:ribonuclease R